MWEDDCGFVFQRKKAPPNAGEKRRPAINSNVVSKKNVPLPVKKSIDSPLTPKQLIDSQRRRRASFVLRPASRHSSIGMNMTDGTDDLIPLVSFVVVVLPMDSHSNYHKHTHPDLPGPVRMRQLLIWAVQAKLKDLEAKGANRLPSETLMQAGQSLVQGLLTNTVNTSWYQRPQSTVVHSSSDSNVRSKSNPQNQANTQCLQWMLQYQQQ